MDLPSIEREALEELEKISNLLEIEAFHSKYLGRKDGALTKVLRHLGTLPPEERKTMGQAANQLRLILEEKYNLRQKEFESASLAAQLHQEKIDVTLPGVPLRRGSSHPIITAINEICGIFGRLGFESVSGPEVETDFNNFTALNIPENHPARDLHDTFYLEKGLLLRTHTSPIQVRLMKTVKPPVRIVSPGRVFRHEAVDATHQSIFHQIEGLAIDTNLSFADLKGVLTAFAKSYFGEYQKVRFRPGYFPFVEPGAEIDLACFYCQGTKLTPEGKPCGLCKATGWIEMLGAGMVHPQVLRNVGYDPSKYQGYAFGLGIERVVMTRLGVRDIRHFLDSDLRFLEQFS